MGKYFADIDARCPPQRKTATLHFVFKHHNIHSNFSRSGNFKKKSRSFQVSLTKKIKIQDFPGLSSIDLKMTLFSMIFQSVWTLSILRGQTFLWGPGEWVKSEGSRIFFLTFWGEVNFFPNFGGEVKIYVHIFVFFPKFWGELNFFWRI